MTNEAERDLEWRPELEKVVAYIKGHWPSKVKPEWQVEAGEYPVILGVALADLTLGKSRKYHLVRIAGISGSGKTTQLLPAAEAYYKKGGLRPVLVAAREFVKYHPHYREILGYYGEAKLREMTDEFCTIMMFLTLGRLTKDGYDIILDVTLLDPEMEKILLGMVKKYTMMMLMLAVAPEVAERQLGGRKWRHSCGTELEFIRSTERAIDFYAACYPEMRVVMWNTFESQPVYDGAIKGAKDIFVEQSSVTKIPKHDELLLSKAKIRYLTAKAFDL